MESGNVVVASPHARQPRAPMAPQSQPPFERRASARVPHRVRAILSTRLGEVAAEVVDLSAGGLGVEIMGELRASDFVRVLLPLAPDDDPSAWVDPDALVARVQTMTGSGRIRLGLSFFQLPPGTLRRIAACITKHMDEPRPAPRPTVRAAPKRPTPSATVAAPQASKATTRELPKAAPVAATRAAPAPPTTTPKAVPKAVPKPAPRPSQEPKAPPLHIPRTSARELRNLFHEALAALEETKSGKKSSD